MSYAISKLHGILVNVLEGGNLNDETFKEWLREYFSNDKGNMEDIFQIQDKKLIDSANKDYVRCKLNFQDFKVKYGMVYVMSTDFILDLQNLLTDLLHLLPMDLFLSRSIDLIRVIRRSILIYKSGISRSSYSLSEVPSKIPNCDIMKMFIDLHSLSKDKAYIFDIFEELMNNVHLWDLKLIKSKVTDVLYKMCSNKNEYWMRVYFGPLNDPEDAKHYQRRYSDKCSNTLFNLCYMNHHNYYSETDASFLIRESVKFIHHMLRQVNVNLLTYHKKFIYYYIRDFFEKIFIQPEYEMSACFYQDFTNFLKEGKNKLNKIYT